MLGPPLVALEDAWAEQVSVLLEPLLSGDAHLWRHKALSHFELN